MRVLLIEDDSKLTSFIVRGLVSEGFAMDSTASGEDGLEMFKAFPYALIILDLMLPGMSGTDVIRAVRLRNSSIPILVLTARDGLDDKVGNFDAGADDYLTKPFAFGEMLARVRVLLRRGHQAFGNVLRFSDLEVDRVTHQVKRAGHPIRLTAKEFSLLEYMIANAGRVLSRTMIINHVWDSSFDGMANIVDVYIRYLREKIDLPFDVPLIQTVRGTGYVLRDPSKSVAVGE